MEVLLISNHNTYFHREIRKVLYGYPLLSGSVWEYYRRQNGISPLWVFIIVGLGERWFQVKIFFLSSWKCKLRLLIEVLLPSTHKLSTCIMISDRNKICWPGWLSWMHVQLVIRRLRVRPPPGWQHSFVEIDHWSWITLYSHSLLSADSRRANVSFWLKKVHNTD